MKFLVSGVEVITEPPSPNTWVRVNVGTMSFGLFLDQVPVLIDALQRAYDYETAAA